jgi:putative nucleotidyltransferase with HDIG domain
LVASTSQGSFGNDEDSWFGGDDREAEIRAEQSVAAVGARIVGAKPFPVAARRLEELTRNPKARLEQVVSVLETDPGLSVRLLRLVNSAGYGLKVRVTSVRHAAVLVGTRRLHQVATTAAILDLFETSNQTAVALLEHAAVVGSLCRYLAVHLGLPHDELFTCGFLHDIGKLMLLDTEGDKYAELVRNYGDAPDQMHIQERRLFGFDHALLGAHVLKAWNIPEPVPKVVLYHHQPARAMQDTLLSSMVYTLRLADNMSYALALESDEEGVALIAESEAAQYLEVSEPQVAAMWSDLRALAERSRARSNGQPDMEVVAPRRLEVPRSMRPRRSAAPRSMPPSSSMAAAARVDGAAGSSRSSAPARGPDVNEVPVHFPCVACSKPSYGNVCAACDGQVCPEHQVGPDHWCVLCVGEYDKFRGKNAIPAYVKVGGLALAGFSVGASITGVMVSQTFAVWKLIVAPLTMVLLWGVLLPVAHRLWQRKRFVNSRPKGRVPLPLKLPRPNPVFISSLDANLENDGLMGPSMPPPSQSGISIIGVQLPGSSSPPSEPTQPSVDAVVAEAKASAALLQQATVVASSLNSIAVTTTSDPPAAIHVGSAGMPSIEVPAPASAVPAPVAEASEEAPPPSEKELDQAAEVLAASSEVMPRADRVEPPASVGALRGAAASLNPPSAPPAAVAEPSAPPALAPAPKKDSVAAHIAALLGESSDGLSEFPSVGSESELENVVLSVSARLAREFPQNDYMGPSADLRAATIAPIPEPGAAPEVVIQPAPVAMASVAPSPAASSPPTGDRAIEAMLEPAVAEPAVAEPAVAEPAVAEPAAAAIELAVAEPAAAAIEPAVTEPAAAVVEPAPISEVAPVVMGPVEPLFQAQGGPEPVPLRLLFPRKSLEQGCAPRTVFRCALPVAESCSPAPRRTSLRPAVQDYAAGESAPNTLRGLG